MDAIFPSVHDGIPPFGCPGNQGFWQAEMKASMLDLPGDEDDKTGSHFENLLQSEIRSIVELISFNSCRNKYQSLLKESGSETKKTESKESSGDEVKEEEADDGRNILPSIENTDTFRLRAQETKW